MFKCYFLACLLATTAIAGHAQSTAQPSTQTACPWLTEGSAARALGAGVTVSVHVSDAGEGSCMFSRTQEPVGSLKIEVSKTVLSACGAGGTKLKGIGNEATRCRLSEPAAQDAEMISGRVRDLYFTITLNVHGKRSSANSSNVQEDTLELTAEQVAGNLF
jgi:hypothetical protein